MEKSYREFYLHNEKVEKSSDFSGDFLKSGKSIYEVIRVIGGLPVFFEKHANRLFNTVKLTKVKLPYSIDEIRDLIKKLVDVNKCTIGNVKIVFNFKDGKCDFYAYFLEKRYPEHTEYKNGVLTIFYFGERNNPNAKVVSKSFIEEINEKIRQKEVYEAILVDRNSNVTEGSRSNVFMVKGKDVYTAPVDTVLPGITREIIIDIIKQKGYNFIEKNIRYSSVGKMDGIFISSAPINILPVRGIERYRFKSSTNAVIKDIMETYDDITKQYLLEKK
ncbi:MAG: aminotransferase class IV [Clostridium sp.]|nr:aminotransferase class IV [Clostridium sp.]